MARPRTLLAAVEASGSGAFLADTAPIIYRVERGASPALVEACDPLFDAVERGEVGCLVSAISVAELLIEPYRAGPAAVSTIDAFLRQPLVGIAEVDGEIARHAAELVAARRLGRLPDAIIASTGAHYAVPIVTGDRRLARSAAAEALLVAEYA